MHTSMKIYNDNIFGNGYYTQPANGNINLALELGYTIIVQLEQSLYEAVLLIP